MSHTIDSGIRAASLASFATLCAGVAGCVTPIFKAPLVSMTRKHVPPGARLVPGGRVVESFCLHDDRLTPKTAPLGLVDEVLLKAQTRTKADYVRNASFALERRWTYTPCMIMHGEAMRLAK